MKVFIDAWQLFTSDPIAPFRFPFMMDAFWVGAMIGTVCAVLSCYLILKGWALMGDAVSHAVFPGIVLAYLAKVPLAIGAFAAGLMCAASTGWIKSNSRVKEDTVLGVVFTGLFALGLVMFSKIESDVHLNHILFGSLLGIERDDKIQAVVAAAITLLVVLVKRKDLMLFCFDPGQARAVGLRTKVLHYLLLSLLAGTIVASLQAVGIILTVAMLIAPGCVAYLLTDKFDRMLIIAVASAVISSVVGVYVSYFINGATGACIVLVQAFIFLATMVFAPKHGILAARRRVKLALA